MAFELPPLPYAYDALAPYMSAETLEFHHDKHHNAYVVNGNNLLKGTGLEGKSLEDVVKASYKDDKLTGLFNNAAQHWNHIEFWQWMKPNGGGSIPGELEKRSEEHTSELQSLMRISYAVFCLKIKKIWTVRQSTSYNNHTHPIHI